MAERKYYDWQATLSRQTGTQGEFCIVVGAKNIGKTFGIRKQCVQDFLKRGERFCEICRTKDEKKQVSQGYFDKFKAMGMFKDYIFKTTQNAGYIAREPVEDEDGKYIEKPDWQLICYFVSLTTFQTEKKRTYTGIKRFIFDEAIIDRKDRYHRYLPDEYLILANILDSISRQQPNSDYIYRVYILGNACDLTCPYLRYLGINQIPEYGYSFWNDKHTLLHYVEPWDAEDMKANTLVGRMLNGLEESDMVFGNVFSTSNTSDIAKKTKDARFMFGVIYNNNTFGLWVDYKQSLTFVSSKVPKDSDNIIALTKADMTIDFLAVERTSSYLRSINRMFYSGLLRYDSPVIKELFLHVLNFLGIK